MRVVATLTTRPNYHSGLKETLNSLTSQFDEVYLGLPYYSIKKEKYKDFSHPKVTVVRLEEDIGPSSKILGALMKEERSKNTLIVSVDDDYNYNPNLRNFFEEERKKDIKSGLTRVLSQSGVYIKYWNFNILGMNGGWHDKNYFFDLYSYKDLTTIAGYAGVAYPSEIFPETQNFIDFITKFKNDSILYRNDDVLISAYISKLNIKKVRVANTIKEIGKNNKDIEEFICPSPNEIFNCCYKLKEYLQKNNSFKYYSLTGLDAIIFIIFIIFIFYFFY